MTNFPEFILASRSPRRRELLDQAGYRFRVVPPPLDEPPPRPRTSPAQLAEALAFFKASSVHATNPDAIILGADTVVSVGDEIFGKADDEPRAREMLSGLSGTRHQVITALALMLPPSRPGDEPHRMLASTVTHVSMRPLTDEEIGRYVASGQWRDKAGAYAIQEGGDAFIEKLEGSFTNVIGLPMELLDQLCRRARRHLADR